MSPMVQRAVFDVGPRRPAFVMARFDTADVRSAESIEADLVVSDETLRFFSDAGRESPQPCTSAQEKFLRSALTDSVDVPIQAAAGAMPPIQVPEADYLLCVQRAVEAIRASQFEKVVLSRAVAWAMPQYRDLLELIVELAALRPQAFVCLVQRPGESAWLTASPETLFAWSAEGVLDTMALAGTQAAPENVDLDAVHWPDKFIDEQALVCRYIRTAFNVCGIDTVKETRPHTVVAGNLMHLRSEFLARIAPERVDLASAFLDAMHPTSAVCGQPRELALAFLRDYEGYDRTYYCGYIGPVGLDGASHLFVNLRTAQLIGETAYLYVGGGIVADSDPHAEWVETVEKLKTVGAVLSPGVGSAAASAGEPQACETPFIDANAGSSAPHD